MKRDEYGQILPLTAIIGSLLVVGSILGLGAVGVSVTEAARAQTAADAAALAGASGGRVAAEKAARANSGDVEQFRMEGTDAVVTVSLGRHQRSARAHPTF